MLVEITESCQVNLELRIMQIFTHPLFISVCFFMVACAATVAQKDANLVLNNTSILKDE